MHADPFTPQQWILQASSVRKNQFLLLLETRYESQFEYGIAV